MKITGLFALVFMLFSCSMISMYLPSEGNLDSSLKGMVFINEVSATHPDDDDWVEIYNASDSSVDLWGFGFSDKPLDPLQWSLPLHSIIAGKSYLVIEFNGKADSPSFGLKDADPLILSTPDGKTTIDSLGSILDTNTASFGRSSDGADTWTSFTTPTKGGPNS